MDEMEGTALTWSRQIQSNVAVPGQDRYTGMMDCFRKIIKNEGYECTCLALGETMLRK